MSSDTEGLYGLDLVKTTKIGNLRRRYKAPNLLKQRNQSGIAGTIFNGPLIILGFGKLAGIDQHSPSESIGNDHVDIEDLFYAYKFPPNDVDDKAVFHVNSYALI